MFIQAAPQIPEAYRDLKMGKTTRRDLKGRLIRVKRDLRFTTKQCPVLIPASTTGVVVEKTKAVQPSWHVLLPDPWHVQVLLETEIEVLDND